LPENGKKDIILDFRSVIVSFNTMKKFLFILIYLSAIEVPGYSQLSAKRILYKQIDTISLNLEVIFQEKNESGTLHPAIIFFYGGGWNSGTVKQFEPHALYYSGKGIVCFLADYRVNGLHKTTPFESLKDAKSAIRFIRKNAVEFKIDTSRIIACGGSAGGHLAAAAALISGFNDLSDDLNISCIPNALILFNPVIDNGPGGYGYERIGEKYKDFSPIHNITKGAPPTIFFLGTKDHHIPLETARYYKTVMEKVGSRCDLILFDGEGHGFFNYKYPENYKRTLIETDKFLISLGYLKP
jgi:acetyl esterase